jgi:undecaprenyl-diphosphatase
MLIQLLQAAILGAVQGVTEFLPISSTAHLAIVQKMFGLDAKTYGLTFDMFTNLGTLTATVIFFWKDLKSIFGRLRFPTAARPLSNEDKLPWTILLSTIPVGVVGLRLKDRIETDFRSLWVIAFTLAAVGILMILVEKYARHTQKDAPKTSQVWGISLSQCLALVPGVSRSGITISAGMLQGLDRVTAARYSFLLSLPITTAAALSQMAKLGKTIAKEGMPSEVAAFYAMGGVVSLIVGYLTIKFLLDFYRKYSLASFAYYRILLSAIILGLLLTNTISANPEDSAKPSPAKTSSIADR